MSKQLTLEELKEKRSVLEAEVNEAQSKLAEKSYTVELESETNLNAVLKQIDKSYEWSIINAALVVNLYDSLKAEKAANRISTEGTTSVQLRSVDLNTLYSVLTNINGTGVEAARTFTRLLANIGAQITASINEMSDANKQIQEMHVQLAELDLAIENHGKVEVTEEEIEVVQ